MPILPLRNSDVVEIVGKTQDKINDINRKIVDLGATKAVIAKVNQSPSFQRLANIKKISKKVATYALALGVLSFTLGIGYKALADNQFASRTMPVSEKAFIAGASMIGLSTLCYATKKTTSIIANWKLNNLIHKHVKETVGDSFYHLFV